MFCPLLHSTLQFYTHPVVSTSSTLYIPLAVLLLLLSSVPFIPFVKTHSEWSVLAQVARCASVLSVVLYELNICSELLLLYIKWTKLLTSGSSMQPEVRVIQNAAFRA